ncbi:glycoside hydrolase family 2 TIM barrel-domain containing protein [Actinophytocola sp.]|uniref:glycoside hydrolase family 2 protein n=1 Tax=Actinophytocola sp. TaxID=1872138 RepID=UPI0025BA770E|nr:glycoside hydrolase family 2 TIM barrel-domain containing protein [Actinophytocola sp.]
MPEERVAGKGLSRRGFLRAGGVGVVGVAANAALARQALAAPAAPTLAGKVVPLEHEWRFGGPTVPGATLPGFDDSHFETVSLPHSNVRMSWHDLRPPDFPGEYAGGKSPYEFISVYRRHFTMAPNERGQRVLVDFGGSMTASKVTINGVYLGEYKGGYTPFSFELTPHIDWRGDNVLAIEVDSRRTRADIPPFGGAFGNDPDRVRVDYDTFGGLYRAVSLRVVPHAFIDNAFARPVNVLTDERAVEVRCYLDRATDAPLVIEVELLDGQRLLARSSARPAPGEDGVELSLDAPDVTLWDVDNPYLYNVRVRLREQDDNGDPAMPIHEFATRIGFREARFTPEGFFLNGHRLQLFGLNRHQIFPYVGNAMPARVQRRDAEILRRELNCNMVRTSHYPQSPDFLDACDELGLLVWDEMPGWQYVGDEAWQDVAVENVDAMIRRDWNHPSIILWAVRINESGARPEFETRLNDLAHRLDPSRQTTGAYNGSQPLRADVRGQNDYRDDMTTLSPPRDLPYLVTEAVGQKRPFGPFDQTYLRTDPVADQQAQALRHAQVHNAAAADQRYSGLVAWCAFEYLSTRNSIHDVKTPGVCDLFRIHKPGASFYRSQVSPAERVVLEPAFYWDFGEKSPNGPGAEAMISSNCERLELYLDGEHLTSAQPARGSFAHLAYPPFFVDLSGVDPAQPLPELRIDGFVGDARVVSRSFSPDRAADQLLLEVDDPQIDGDGIDATRVVFRALDRHGAPRPFVTGDVTFTMTGPGELLGENPFQFEVAGGAGAVWIRGKLGSVGRVVLRAAHPTLGTKQVEVTVRRIP